MKSAEVTHWWDRGRARWRARPANKERSYEEYVHGKRRPHRIADGGERRSVRVALGQYARHAGAGLEGYDEFFAHFEDAATVHGHGEFHRWSHATKRSEQLARARSRRVTSMGRKFQNARPFQLPMTIERWCAAQPDLVPSLSRRELLRAACARLLDGGAIRSRYQRTALYDLRRDEDFRRAVPESKRLVIALACLRGVGEYVRRYGDEGLEGMLEALSSDHGRLAGPRAAEWALRFQLAETTPPYRRSAAATSRPLVARARSLFERRPALARAFYAWIERHAEAA